MERSREAYSGCRTQCITVGRNQVIFIRIILSSFYPADFSFWGNKMWKSYFPPNDMLRLEFPLSDADEWWDWVKLSTYRKKHYLLGWCDHPLLSALPSLLSFLFETTFANAYRAFSYNSLPIIFQLYHFHFHCKH